MCLRLNHISANGIDFAFYEVGDGPLALCLHGFPDSASTWRYLLPELANAGFRAVAPFMRGYAPTQIPASGCYDLGELIRDASALHEVLDGDENAVLIGHDWGAETAYGAAGLEPNRWEYLVTLSVPPLALDGQFFSDYDQLKRFFHLYFLKTQGAESVVAAEDMAFLDRIWEDWSPGYDAAQDLTATKRCLRDPGNLSAAVGYYRAAEPRQDPTADHPFVREHQALFRVAPQPTLYLHGMNDGCIDIGLVADATAHMAGGSQLRAIEGAGHFAHLERPQEVNDLILKWVTRANLPSSRQNEAGSG